MNADALMHNMEKKNLDVQSMNAGVLCFTESDINDHFDNKSQLRFGNCTMLIALGVY